MRIIAILKYEMVNSWEFNTQSAYQQAKTDLDAKIRCYRTEVLGFVGLGVREAWRGVQTPEKSALLCHEFACDETEKPKHETRNDADNWPRDDHHSSG